MREMKPGSFLGRQHTPLVVKGSLPRAFLSLGVFVEVGLLFLGSYLLTQAMMKPLQATSATVISGGVLLSLASVLLFYLLASGRPDWRSRRNRDLEEDSEASFIDVSARAIPEERETSSASERAGDSTGENGNSRVYAAGNAGR